MSTLNGRTPADSFPALLKINRANDSTATSTNPGIDATLRNVEDGLGNQTPLKLSSTQIALNDMTWPTSGAAVGKFLQIGSTNQLRWLTFSVAGDLQWNSSTGVLSYSLGFTPVNKAGDTMTGFLTLSADPTSNLHAATKAYVDNKASVQSVNTKTGAVTLTTTDISEGSNQYFTIARARSSLSGTGIGLSYNSTSGVITFDQTALSITESQITNGSLLARVANNETITGTWTFSNPVSGANPVAASDLATKQYVDNYATGLDFKQSVRAATTGNIALSGLQTIDGVSLLGGDRVLVKDQSTASQNGIYIAASGSWARAYDADNSPNNEVNAGMFCFVQEGTVNADTGWVLATNNPITLGTTALNFVQFSGAGLITAGNGLAKTGNLLSVQTVSSSRIAVSASGVDLATVTDSGTGSFKKITVDSYGRVSGTSSVVKSDLVSLFTTDDITEGSTNKFFSNSLVRGAISVSGTGLSYSSSTGVITTNATSSNTASTVVARDASGNFTAGTITAALTGNASTASQLQTSRSISATGDATWTVNFDGSANATAALTLATVNSAPVSSSLVKVTVNGKGLVTATSAVTASDVTTSLGYTPVNKAGDTMTGGLTAPTLTAITSATIANMFFTSQSGNIASGNTTSAIGDVSASLFTTVKYMVTLKDTTTGEYETTEILLVYDGTNINMTQFGTVLSGVELGTFSATIAIGQIRLTFTKTTSNAVDYKTSIIAH